VRSYVIQYSADEVIQIETNDLGAGFCSSSLPREEGQSIGAIAYNASLDAIELYLLGLAAEGMDLSLPAYSAALVATMDTIGNHLSDKYPNDNSADSEHRIG
jgi:stage V sporulation protein SpoVS